MKRTVASVLCLLSVLGAPRPGAAQEIKVDAGQELGSVSPLLTAACLEDVNHEVYGGLYSQMVFGESFQEPPPSLALRGFQMLGGRWTATGGTIRLEAADGPKLVRQHPGFTDGEAGVNVRFPDASGQNAGLIVRVSKAGPGADNFVGYEVALEPRRQQLHLARHRGNYEPIAHVPCEVRIGRWVALAVRLDGPIVEVFVDGRSVLRHDDGKNALPAGTVGLRGWHSTADFRDFWVRSGKEKEPLRFEPIAGAAKVSGMWSAVQDGTARGDFGLVTDGAFLGAQSQAIHFATGEGRLGIANQGLNRWGMSFVAGKPYEGLLWVRSVRPATLVASLENRDGSKCYAEAAITVPAGDWHRLTFTLTPNADDPAGRFALALRQPGEVTVGHAFLQPGEWGRFKGLPVRRDVAEGLIDQGITLLRYGGSMVNIASYKWKQMIGPRDRRPPYVGFWYPYSTNGWGIIDFMNFAEAAGFEYVPAFNIDETPEDLAAFVEYARGPADSPWGRKRVADGHPQPYRLRYLELGNEERVDERYAAKFEALARAIWAKDPGLVPVVGDFSYNEPIRDPMHFKGADSGITSLAGHRQVLALARKLGREVWFDVHLWTEGPGASPSLKALPSYVDALERLAGGANHRVVVFELNSNNHDVRRALGSALATNVIERDGRLPVAAAANCLQPDRQNDNGWDQGMLFLTPSRVWLQPPGYVTRMRSRHYQPRRVRCAVAGKSTGLDAVASLSKDGKTLVLQVVNTGDEAVGATLTILGFVPSRAAARITTLSGPLGAANTAERPDAVVPQSSEWTHRLADEIATFRFLPHSFTVIRFD